jgi:hypothetical protein
MRSQNNTPRIDSSTARGSQAITHHPLNIRLFKGMLLLRGRPGFRVRESSDWPFYDPGAHSAREADGGLVETAVRHGELHV